MYRAAGPDSTALNHWDRFFDFIAPDADRCGMLLELTKRLALNAAIISIAGNRHLFVFPPGQCADASAAGSFPFRGQSPVILTAHYDRVEGSPGANDNSAAVFQLLTAAARLGRLGSGRWMIIFTDKEELKAGEGIEEQGAFSLAEKLRAGGLAGARVFNFDACGSGEAFIVSTTTDFLMKNDERPGIRRTRHLLRGLRSHVLNTARFLRLRYVFTVPTPFSDDAGFLRAGLPAQTITMLPAGEAIPYISLLRRRPGFAGTVISGTMQNAAGRLLIPETWRILNSPADSHLRLTPQHYESIVRFAVTLCRG